MSHHSVTQPEQQLSNLLDRTAQETPQATCAETSRRTLSYGAAREALVQHQRWLEFELNTLKTQDSLSSREDDDVVIAYLSPNFVDFFLSVLACTSEQVCGLPALLNTRWTVAEMAASLLPQHHQETLLSSTHSNAITLLLYGPGFQETAEQVARASRHATFCRPIPTFSLNGLVVLREPAYTSAVTTTQPQWQQQQQHLYSPSLSTTFSYSTGCYSRRDALIVFTSGTSSRKGAKGVRLSHAAIAIQAAAKKEAPCCYSSDTTLLASTLPFCHIGGVTNLLSVWMVGGRLVLPMVGSKGAAATAGFNPENVFSLVQSQTFSEASQVNSLVVVPAMLFALEQYRQHQGSSEQYPGVELIVVGGQSISNRQQQFLIKTFPSARVVQTYACTEAASSLTFYTVPLLESSPDSSSVADSSSHAPMGDCVGVPPPHVELCLFDKDRWKETGAMEKVKDVFAVGVIATRGPHLMNGYWQRGAGKQQSSRHMIRNQKDWFVTNDLGCWDAQGRLFFCGRVNDSIRTGGETVFPLEVERILLLHPNVDECAVFALPDSRFGEAVSCAIVCSENESPCPSLRILRDWCQQQGLAGYKRPRRVFQVKELPKNSSGKTLKYLLVEQFRGNDNTMQSKL